MNLKTMMLFNGNMNTHRSCHEFYNLNGFIAHKSQHGCYPFLRGIFFKGFKDICVCRCIAATQPAKDRQHPCQI